MKKVVKVNSKAGNKICRKPVVYIIVKSTEWIAIPFQFSGRYKKERYYERGVRKSIDIPLVYKRYKGKKGDVFVLRDLYEVTKGFVLDWTFSETAARNYVLALNRYRD